MSIEQRERRALSAAAGKAYRQQLTSAELGTISVRLPSDGLFLMTPFGIGLKELKSEDICLIDSQGKIIGGSTGLSVSPDTSLYLNAYRVRSDVNAIAHLHPAYATSYAARGQLFRMPGRAGQVLKEVLKVDCRKCPSRFNGLCSCTDIRTSYSGANALLLREDGILTLGTDISSAIHLAELMENAAKRDFLASI